MQKFILMIIATIVHYIASGNGHYPLETESTVNSPDCELRVKTIGTLQNISLFSQNGAELNAKK